MEFYDAINKRRTTREFLDKPVDFEKIKRILEAGNKAPTWDHNRNWQYIILRTDEEKEYAFEYAKSIADKFDADKYLNFPRPYPITLGQKMYGYAMPRQYTMLKEGPYVVIPLFKSKELNGEYVSKLNPFATIWCVIENIFLATTVNLIGNKWKPLILRELLKGTQRFKFLQYGIEGISAKVLTENLRQMEEDGLVKREVFAEIPLRVEYSLTALGEKMRPIIKTLEIFGKEYKQAVKEN